MSVRSHIEDGQGTSTLAKVMPNNALRVSNFPPISAAGLTADELTNVKFYQEFFSNSAGATDMNVDGSVTAVDFEIQSELNLVKWINEFRINIEGEQFEISTNDFRSFGAVASPGLTNGIEIFTIQSGVRTDISSEPIRISGEFLNYSDDFTNFVNAISSQGDFLQLIFRFSQPIALPQGVPDRLVVRIQDDLTAALVIGAGAGQMKAIAKGYKEFL